MMADIVRYEKLVFVSSRRRHEDQVLLLHHEPFLLLFFYFLQIDTLYRATVRYRPYVKVSRSNSNSCTFV